MMASFTAKMGHQQSSDQLQRPLLAMATQGCSGENHDQKAPETLNESRASTVKRLIPQFLLLVIPACFIVLGACIAMINGKAESKAGEAIVQATTVSATLWPIAFAAVVGPMVKAIALHSAERGTTLGTLEVVSASQTLVSTLRVCLHFRIFSLWTFGLAAVWTLSPAGGQGVSRAVQLQKNRTSSHINIQSYPPNDLSQSGDAFNAGASGGASLYNEWSGVSGAAFLAPDVGLMHSNGSSDNFHRAAQRAGGDALAIQSTRRDLWGNVRVPMLHLLPGYQLSQPFEWVNISSDTVPPYDSLIGLPMRGMKSDVEGNGTTIISSYYHYFSCGSWVDQKEWLLQNPIDISFASIVNGTIVPETVLGGVRGIPTIYMDILDSSKLNEQTKSKKVLLFATGRTSTEGDITLCEVTASHIDSSVDCTRSSEGGELSCAAKAARHTKGFPVAGNSTAFDYGLTWTMFSQIVFILSNVHPSSVGMLEIFLEDPPSTFNDTGETQANYTHLSPEVFSARLSMLVNTFLRSSMDMQSLVGMKSLGVEENSGWNNSTGIWQRFTPDVYVVKKPWFTLYMASTLVMTLCALANIVIRGMTRAPDFLGSVSALTRDSPFVDAPPGGSAMDGMQRARLLKNKWVRIQDVKPDEDVGRIAFSDAKGPGRLRMDRQYE